MKNNLPENLYPTTRQAISVMVLAFFAMLLSGAFTTEWDSKYLFITSRVIFVIPMFVFLVRENYSMRMLLRLRPVSLRIAGISAMIGLCLGIIGEELDRIMTMIIPLPEELLELLNSGMQAESALDWLVLIVGVIVLTAILEELLFRCFLQTTLESKLDITRAVITTAFVFSFFYANPISIVQIVLAGVVLGVLAWKSDSFLPSACAHMMINAVGIALADHFLGQAGILNWNGHVHPFLLLPVCLVLYVSIVLFYRFVEEDLEISTFLNEPM